MLDKITVQQFSSCPEMALFQWWVKQLCLSCSHFRLPCKYSALLRFQIVALI